MFSTDGKGYAERTSLILLGGTLCGEAGHVRTFTRVRYEQFTSTPTGRNGGQADGICALALKPQWAFTNAVGATKNSFGGPTVRSWPVWSGGPPARWLGGWKRLLSCARPSPCQNEPPSRPPGLVRRPRHLPLPAL